MGNFKVGDKVRVKSSKWYHKNLAKSGRGFFWVGSNTFTPEMSAHCGEIVTISSIVDSSSRGAVEYYIEEELVKHHWTDEMFEETRCEFDYMKFGEFYIVYNTISKQAYPDIIDTIEDVNKLIDKLVKEKQGL